MGKSAAWWRKQVTMNLARSLLQEKILPTSGAWVTIDWLVRRTRHLVTPYHATSNYKRLAPTRRPNAHDEPLEERRAMGHRWLIIDALKTHRRNRLVEWNGQKGDDARRYRLVVARPDDEDMAAYVPTDIEVVLLPLRDLRIDSRLLQTRERNEGRIQDFVAYYDQGDPLPPVRAVRDGDIYWLWDGFHRCAALIEHLEWDMVECEVSAGTLAQAQALASGANKGGDKNEMHRTAADKRRAVKLALAPLGHWSDSKIAEWVGVDDKTVAKIRAKTAPRSEQTAKLDVVANPDATTPAVSPSEFPNVTDPDRREGADGKLYPSKRAVTTAEEKAVRIKSTVEMREAGKTFRQIAEALGVSPEQASRDWKAAKAKASAAQAEASSPATPESPPTEPVSGLADESRLLDELRRLRSASQEAQAKYQDALDAAPQAVRERFLQEISA